MFEKLYKFIGKSIKLLIERDDESYCLRLQKLRVFYVRESLMRRATNVRTDLCISPVAVPRTLPLQHRVHFRRAANQPVVQVSREKLVALGTCIGKFTHSGKFRLTVGALDIVAAYAKFKVCSARSFGTSLRPCR